MKTREAAARRAAERFGRFFEVKPADESLVYQYFLAHAAPDGTDSAPEILRRDGVFSDEDFALATELRRAFFRRFGTERLLYFADVDNTVTQRGELSEEKKRFFSSWELSRRVILSTGKIYKSIENTARELGLDANPCCCLNGAVLYDGRGGERIIAGLREAARPAARMLAEKGLSYVLYYPDALRAETALRQKDLENLARYDEMFLDKGGETDYKKVIKLLAFVDEGDAEKEAVVDAAARAINLKALRTAPHSYEIVSPLVDKGRALKLTAESLNAHFRMTAAVGDSMNDLPMLASCGLPFAVSDASDALAVFGFPSAGADRKTDLPELFASLASGNF